MVVASRLVSICDRDAVARAAEQAAVAVDRNGNAVLVFAPSARAGTSAAPSGACMTERIKAQQAGKRIDGDSFKDARLIAALTVQQAAAQLGVTRRTIRNWEAGRAQVPYSAFELLRILSGYALPGKAWVGWLFVDHGGQRSYLRRGAIGI